MSTIASRLKEVGQAQLRDEQFARRQLSILHELDRWFNGNLETISIEEDGGVDVVKSILRGDCQYGGGRGCRHMIGIELSTGEFDHYTPQGAENLAWKLAEELGIRAKQGAIDWQHLTYLIPELGMNGSKDAIDVMRRHEVLVPHQTDPHLSQVATKVRRQ